MAAGPEIFSRLQLNKEKFEVSFIEWLIPEGDEPIEEYAKRMASCIEEDEVVLIGVSFGGIIAQEIKKIKPLSKVIIISSIKSDTEFPERLRWFYKTSLHKIVPVSWAKDVGKLKPFAFTRFIRRKIDLYELYLNVNDPRYLKWALDKVLSWKCTKEQEEVFHIHGDCDSVFPIVNIKNCCVIKGGTHAMIINKSKEIRELIENEIETKLHQRKYEKIRY